MESLFQGSSPTVVSQGPLQPEVLGLRWDGMRCDSTGLPSPRDCLSLRIRALSLSLRISRAECIGNSSGVGVWVQVLTVASLSRSVKRRRQPLPSDGRKEEMTQERSVSK